MNSLILFVVLQVADILSTLVFLAIGVQEGNPAVRVLLHFFTPIVSLVLVKAFGIGLGIAWHRLGRSFTKINMLYSLLVLWNVIAIVVQLSK